MAEEEVREEETPPESEEEQPTETDTEEETQEEEGTEEETEEAPKRTGVQKRIDELTRARRQAEREAEYWRSMAQEKLPKPEEEKPADTSKKPSRDDFDYEEDYQDALTDWRVEQKLAEARQKEQAEKERKTREEQQQTLAQNIQSINQKGSNEFEDYAETVLENRDLPITDSMVRTISEMENGHRVAYHLGHNPQKAAEIAQKSPYRQALELAKLEAQLNAKPPKKTTNAPPPTEGVKGKEEGAKAEPKDIDAWMKWRWRHVRGE